MHRLWISVAVLIALFCAALYNTHYLGCYTEELTALLTEAESSANRGDWKAAAEKTDAALDRWQNRGGYLHVILQHRDTDEILLNFREVRQLIDHREDGGEYAAANAKLITRIGLLYEMEQLSWKNLF